MVQVPLSTFLQSRAQAYGDVHIIPYIVFGLRMITAPGTRRVGINTLSICFQQLTKDFTSTLDDLSQSFSTPQNQVDSLARVI
jgi:hypothetical protein